MTHNLAFRVVFPISAVLLLTSSMAAVRPPVRTSPCAAAAAQYLGQPIRSLDPGRIAGILEQAARQLSEGRLKAHLPPGHKLFTVCSESDDLAVAHVPPPGEARDDAAEQHVKAMIGHVWEAARVLNVEEAFETALGRHGLGRRPALVSIGPLGSPGAFSPGTGLVSFRSIEGAADGNPSAPKAVDVVHEVLGHTLFHYHCTGGSSGKCPAKRESFISWLIEEAHAYTMDHLYSVFHADRTGNLSDVAEEGHRGYDRRSYMQIAIALLQSRPEYRQHMRTYGRVPREWMAQTLAALAERPMALYLYGAAGHGFEFGTDQDLKSSLLRIPYLDDVQRLQVAAAVRNSAWYRQLGRHARPDRTAVAALIKPPAPPTRPPGTTPPRAMAPSSAAARPQPPPRRSFIPDAPRH